MSHWTWHVCVSNSDLIIKLAATISTFDDRLKVQIRLVTSSMAVFLCLPLAFAMIQDDCRYRTELVWYSTSIPWTHVVNDKSPPDCSIEIVVWWCRFLSLCCFIATGVPKRSSGLHRILHQAMCWFPTHGASTIDKNNRKKRGLVGST